MDQLIPGLQVLLGALAPAFRQEVHGLFCQMVAAWIVCLGRRSISRVWETTGQAEQRNHAAAFRLFSQAAWDRGPFLHDGRSPTLDAVLRKHHAPEKLGGKALTDEERTKLIA